MNVHRRAAVLAVLVLAACAAPLPALDERTLATELERRPAVLLGEVHDNPIQHRARADALKRLLEQGARPVLAFEQFDRDRQAAIDRARNEQPPAGRTLAAHVIESGRTPKDGWDWAQYQPFVELALQYGLPIVAANLSRTDAGRVAREGLDGVFDPAARKRLALDTVDPVLQRRFEDIVREAHCNALPEALVPGLATAQIARDAVLADSIRPYLATGVVLLTGNGHVRRDVGVPRHLSSVERERVWSIGLLEAGDNEDAGGFDVAFVTPRHARPDPCEGLRARQK
jgi:uncharacterized iron-regulated protein